LNTVQAPHPRGWRFKTIAKEYGVSESFLKQAFYAGKLKGTKYDRVVVFLDRDVRKFFGDYDGVEESDESESVTTNQ